MPSSSSAVTSKTSNIRANFENLAKEQEQQDRRKAEAERAQRLAREQREREEAARRSEVSGGCSGSGLPRSAPGTPAVLQPMGQPWGLCRVARASAKALGSHGAVASGCRPGGHLTDWEAPCPSGGPCLSGSGAAWTPRGGVHSVAGKEAGETAAGSAPVGTSTQSWTSN